MTLLSPIRIGLLGYGWVNQKIWEPRLAQNSATKVVARYDSFRRNGVCNSIEDFWAIPMDAVIIGTPNRSHAELGREAAKLGLSVVLEKPSCLSVADYDSIARLMTPNTVLLTASPACLRDDVRQLLRSVGSGPFDIEASWLRREGVPGATSWFTDRRYAGGGALLDLGWHLADVVYSLFEPKLTEVSCSLVPIDGNGLNDASWRRGVGPMFAEGSNQDVDVTGSLTASYEDGTRLRISTSWSSEVEYDSTVIRIATSGESATLRTTFGLSPVREPAPSLLIANKRGPTALPCPVAPGSEYETQVEALVTEIRNAHSGGAVQSGWSRNARAITDLMEQAYKSANAPLTR